MAGKDESGDPRLVPPPELPDTALYDLTDKCYDAFERLVEADSSSELRDDESPGAAPRDLLGLKNSFAFWVDYVGALAPVSASLDDRLAGSVEIKEMIIELLEMVERNIHQLEQTELLRKGPEWNQSLSSIGAALDRLHFLASAIRKASAKKVYRDETLLNFATDEEVFFKNTAISYVKWKFPKARKSLREHLGVTIAARRRIMSNKNRHERRLATRRTDNKSTSKEIEMPAESPSPAQLQTEPLKTKEQGTAGTEVTRASKLDHSLAIKYIRREKPTLSIRSSGTSRQEDSVSHKYPPLPKVPPRERHVLCPYCRKPLDASNFRGSQATEYWERHIDGDLQPYVCLFTQCLGEFSTRRSDWVLHMRTTHGIDWPRKVHCATWFCDIGHTDIVEFDNEIDWRAHMRDSAQHPGRKKGPTDLQLQALAIKKQQFALRDEHVCPICEEVPQKISILGGKGNRDDMARVLEDHIARHIKNLSFLSLPTLEDELKDEADSESATPEGSRQRLLNPGSAPHPPSDFEGVETASLTFSDSHRSSGDLGYDSDFFQSQLQKLSDLAVATESSILSWRADAGMDRERGFEMATETRLAVTYIRERQFEKVIGELEDIVRDYWRIQVPGHPNRLNSQCMLAEAYLETKRTKQAIELFERIAPYYRALAEENTTRLKFEHLLASAYLQGERTQQGIAVLEHILVVYQRAPIDKQRRRNPVRTRATREIQLDETIAILEYVIDATDAQVSVSAAMLAGKSGRERLKVENSLKKWREAGTAKLLRALQKAQQLYITDPILW
ncbi:hypothetical protein GGR58DRAFT_472437 [Xylaria digitata]|nr:hypothetical protein GGR58DRAFT_472437 [Xylaria digitata]